jgi:hypothetical protein
MPFILRGPLFWILDFKEFRFQGSMPKIEKNAFYTEGSLFQGFSDLSRMIFSIYLVEDLFDDAIFVN